MYKSGDWVWIRFGFRAYKAKVLLYDNKSNYVIKANQMIGTIPINCCDILVRCEPPNLFLWLIGWY